MKPVNPRAQFARPWDHRRLPWCDASNAMDSRASQHGWPAAVTMTGKCFELWGKFCMAQLRGGFGVYPLILMNGSTCRNHGFHVCFPNEMTSILWLFPFMNKPMWWVAPCFFHWGIAIFSEKHLKTTCPWPSFFADGSTVCPLQGPSPAHNMLIFWHPNSRGILRSYLWFLTVHWDHSTLHRSFQ